jgi:hypothetical protein
MTDVYGVTSVTYVGVSVVGGVSGLPPAEVPVPVLEMVLFSLGGEIHPEATTIRITDIQQRRQITFCFIF